MKRWWARVNDRSDYGTWVPTGCVNLDEAKFYMSVYPGEFRKVREWLLL